jgi:hypothetical protein
MLIHLSHTNISNIIFCPQLSVTVSNGETDYRYDLPLEVQYRDSTPWFKYLKYTVTISEDTAIETSIIQVHATTNKGFVVYTVQGKQQTHTSVPSCS